MLPGTSETQLPSSWAHAAVVRAYWVEPGRLLAGAFPGHAVELLVGAGVRTFVDLTSPADGLPDYAPAAIAAGARARVDVRVERLPIPDFGTLEPPGYDEILASLASATEHGAVYVHCWGGIGRTGTVVGCWLVDRGLTADQAIARIAALRAASGAGNRRSPETAAQIKVIRARAARRA